MFPPARCKCLIPKLGNRDPLTVLIASLRQSGWATDEFVGSESMPSLSLFEEYSLVAIVAAMVNKRTLHLHCAHVYYAALDKFMFRICVFVQI